MLDFCEVFSAPCNKRITKGAINVAESDIELGPVTSSPVRKKRNKRTYFRGTKKRRIKSKAQKAIKTEPATLMYVYRRVDFKRDFAC